MSPLPVMKRPPIEPVYSQAQPNQPIELGDVKVEFTSGDKAYQETARVVMHFVPDDYLWFFLPINDVEFTLSVFGRSEGIEFTLPDRGVSVEVLYHGTNVGKEVEQAFISRKSVITPVPSSESLSAAIFHLLNFPDFHGPEDYWITSEETAPAVPSTSVPPGGARCGRVILKADGWKITIAATDKTYALVEAVAREGGYVITHMGRIERENGARFSTKELEDLLHGVYLFLSFALGRRAGVAFPVGFDADGNRAFEQWGLPIVAVDTGHRSFSWFDDSHAELLSEVFPGFLTLWNDSSWKDHLRKTLYWYLAANERGTGIGQDAGIILAQTALERLAWAYCVQHRRLATPDTFGKGRLKAADQIRMLSAVLGIPPELPSTASVLTGIPARKLTDIPDAVTAVRNALVHPSEEKSFFGSPHYYEAWRLSMWLLDLALLRLCNHNGSYINRVGDPHRAGLVEKVPWAR